MLLSEFETLTDIHPDAILYGVIEREYNDGDWQSHAQFCNAYKFDEDGLATKCQRIANDEIWRKDEQHRTAQEKSDNRVHGLYNENQLLRKEVEDQIAKRSQLEADKQELEREIENMRKLLIGIGRAVIAYVDLLDWEACYGTDN